MSDIKRAPCGVHGTKADKIIGYATIEAVQVDWHNPLKDEDQRLVTAAGYVPVLHVAQDDSLLVRSNGGYRFYVERSSVRGFQYRDKRAAKW